MKKGTHVQYRDQDGLHQGIVVKGTTKPNGRVTVILIGGKMKAAGPASAFKPCTIDIPKDEPSPMDDYLVTGYKEFPQMSQETIAFVARVKYKGKVILEARNDGCGGCTYFYGNGGAEEQFQEDIRQWARQFGGEDMTEKDDFWLQWWVNERPYGVTAKAAIQHYNDEWQKFITRRNHG